MARKALITVLVYLSQVKKVVNSVFEQLQNNYKFNNALLSFKLILCWDFKVCQLVIIIHKY